MGLWSISLLQEGLHWEVSHGIPTLIHTHLGKIFRVMVEVILVWWASWSWSSLALGQNQGTLHHLRGI